MFDAKLDKLMSTMKEEIIKSVAHRIEVLEGELHDSQVKNDKLTKQVKSVEDKLKDKINTIENMKTEWRTEAFVKIKRKKFGGGGGGSGQGGGRVGGQGGWERRIEAFVKIQKKYFFFFFWGGGGRIGGSEVGVRSGVGEVEVGVARFGVGG